MKEDLKPFLKRAAALCSQAEKCRADLFQKLRSWGLQEEEIQIILAYLEKEGFIDEQRFASAFAMDKFRFGKWGKLKIRQALRMKRIADSCINQALKQIPQDEYNDMIGSEIRKKAKSTIHTGQARVALFRFGLSRGYEPETMEKLFSDLGPDSF